MTSLARPWVFCTATASRHEEVEAQRLRGCRLLVTAAPARPGRPRGRCSSCSWTSTSSTSTDAVLGAELVDPADHLEVGAQAGERRAQLVRGVEHELALGSARRLERLEQPVERAPQPAQLVGAARARAAGRRRSSRPGPRRCRSASSAGRGRSGPPASRARSPAGRRSGPRPRASSASVFSSELTLTSVAICSAPPYDEVLARENCARGQVLDVLAHLVAVHRRRW